jgi:prevent-host-death family protein
MGDYMEVGVRELKARLSHYLSCAQAGEEVIVTDRGRPVVRLEPYAATALERGIEEGWVEPPRRSRLNPPLRLKANRSVMDVLDEDRG